MNKNLVYLVLCVMIMGGMLPYEAKSQQVDYNKIILPDDAENITFEERLVQLAWSNYPANLALYEELKIAKYDISLANSNPLNKIILTGNLNEFNIDPSSNPNPNNFFPRYNVGVSIPLGIVFSTRSEVKTAKSNYAIVEHQINEMKLVVRSEVLMAYQEYLRTKSIYEIQTQTTELYESSFAIVKSKFLSDDANLEDYNEVLMLLNQEKQKNATAATEFEKSKILLERMIGFPLNQVFIK